MPASSFFNFPNLFNYFNPFNKTPASYLRKLLPAIHYSVGEKDIFVDT